MIVTTYSATVTITFNTIFSYFCITDLIKLQMRMDNIIFCIMVPIIVFISISITKTIMLSNSMVIILIYVQMIQTENRRGQINSRPLRVRLSTDFYDCCMLINTYNLHLSLHDRYESSDCQSISCILIDRQTFGLVCKYDDKNNATNNGQTCNQS